MTRFIIKIMNSKLLPFGILAAGITITAGIIATAPANEPETRAEKAWPVTTLVARPSRISPTLLLFGKVETPTSATLTAAVSAEVMQVPVREGQFVQSGQVLIALDQREADLAVMQAQADVDDIMATLSSARAQHAANRKILGHEEELFTLNENKLQRYEQLRSNGQVSEALLDDVRQEARRQVILLEKHRILVQNFPNMLAKQQAQLNRAEAILQQVRIDQERTTIRSPYSGRIASVLVAVGDRTLTGSAVVELYDTGALEIRTQVPGEHLAQMRTALAEKERIEAVITTAEESIDLYLDRLSGKVNQGSSGVDALFRLSQPTEHLELGRVVDLKVTLPLQENVIAVPVQAIYGDSRIYTLTEMDRLNGIDIHRIGERSAQGELQILIRSSQIRAGDQIVTTQLPKAVSGLKVKVNSPTQT
jgi:RND family efflux transporter MFP subunit